MHLMYMESHFLLKIQGFVKYLQISQQDLLLGQKAVQRKSLLLKKVEPCGFPMWIFNPDSCLKTFSHWSTLVNSFCQLKFLIAQVQVWISSCVDGGGQKQKQARDKLARSPIERCSGQLKIQLFNLIMNPGWNVFSWYEMEISNCPDYHIDNIEKYQISNNRNMFYHLS